METEKLLMDIATRMPDDRAIAAVVAQLQAVLAQSKELQRTLNTCVWVLTVICLLTGVIAWRLA